MTAESIQPTHYDVELDDEPAPSRSPVFVDVVAKVHEVAPIIPANLRSIDGIRATVKRNVTLTARRFAVHAVRLPFTYVPLAAFWGTVGLFKLLGRQIAWWWLAEQYSLRQHAANTNDWVAFEKLLKTARAVRLYRGIVLAGELLATAAVVVLLSVTPGWVMVLVVVCVLPPLARYGRPVDRRIVRPAVVVNRVRRINSDIVLRAYYRAGLGHPDKPDEQITFPSTMSRDRADTGSEVLIDLPYGKTLMDAIKAKSAIASGLDVTEYQVFLTRDKSSVRRHKLFVADHDPLAIPVGRTDLLDCKPRSVWRPMRLGRDERNELVELYLLWVSILIGAQPRKGKTFTARLIALYAALDPWVRIIVADGKQSPDWDKMRLVAHRFIVGTHPNPRDPDPIGNLLAALDEVLEHIRKVNDVLSQLPVDLCPEGKLTEQLARDPRFPDLRVWLLVAEEFQVYFETEDQEVNKQVASKLSQIQAQGPSAGVIIVGASQKPSGIGAGDVSRLFNRFRDNFAVRFALRCGNRDVSMAVLGGDAYSEGYDASALPVGDEYRGVGYLYGAADATPTVRTFFADHPDAEKILKAARQHRERAGTLTGVAAGEDMAREYRDVLRDVRDVFYAGEAWISWEQLAGRMAEQMPEHYADLTKEAISAQVRALKAKEKKGREGERTLWGVPLEQVDQAIQRREIEGQS